MSVVLVHVYVKPERINEFILATLDNAKNSRLEPGVIAFNLIQDENDPAKFIIIEEYKDKNAANAHKDTRHYRVWREAVMDMMAEPRQGIWFNRVENTEK
jgi:(4S)-4-hydroxy-5-phosphonooxypentane-2,3-dione isomerase